MVAQNCSPGLSLDQISASRQSKQLRTTCQCHHYGCSRGYGPQCTCFSTALSCCCSLVFLADGPAMACVQMNLSSIAGAVVAATGAGLSSASGELCFEESLCLLSDGVSATVCKGSFDLGFGFTICTDRLRASKPSINRVIARLQLAKSASTLGRNG